jgi:NhaA family Na+:H+ antiporter
MFARFVQSGQAAGVLLLACTLLALTIANSGLAGAYHGLWHVEIAGLSAAHWINDGLMAIFFLLIGLELEREIYVGELSAPKNALLPFFAAAGGMAAPAAIHLALNGERRRTPGLESPWPRTLPSRSPPSDFCARASPRR